MAGRLGPDSRDDLRRGGGNFEVPREQSLIEYVPVDAEHRTVLTDSVRLITYAAKHRRTGIDLATLALQALQVDGVVDRVRQAPFPGIRTLVDAIG